MRKKLVYSITILIFLIPFWSFLAWWLTPKKTVNVLIMDKTVLNKKGYEHRSFNWILTHERYVQPNGKPYKVAKDYYGFFPKDDFLFEIKDINNWEEEKIDSLADTLDILYLTDMYGIYENEWFKKGDEKNKSKLVYGGLKQEEVSLMIKMKERKKLVIAEFNLFASPTGYVSRNTVEKEFDLNWTGWMGRYFYNLDTALNNEIPKWLIHLYEKQYEKTWNFQSSGVVLIREDDSLMILENKKHLVEEIPYILTNEENQKKYGVIKDVPFPFWFEITKNTGNNKIISEFEIATTPAGDSTMAYWGLKNRFPASFEHYNEDYKFFYFAGDFCDNPNTKSRLSHMKGISKIKNVLYNPGDIQDRQEFFWTYYEPMISKIVNKYYSDHITQ